MRRMTGRLVCGTCRGLRAASLLEAVVAAVLFLTVFAAAMELVPRLTLRDDDALRVAEAEYRAGQAFEKYATGLWPCGEYAAEYGWGRVAVLVEPYRDFADMQVVTVTALIGGSSKRIVHKRLVACVQ